MERKLKRQRRVTGSIVKIPLENGYHTYARVFEQLFAFYDVRTKAELSVNGIIEKKVLFITGAYSTIIENGYWHIIGKKKPIEKTFIELEHQPMYTEDDIIGKCIIHYFDGSQKVVEHEAVKDLEVAAIWTRNSIEKRLNDFYAERYNKEVEDMKNGMPVTGMLKQA